MAKNLLLAISTHSLNMPPSFRPPPSDGRTTARRTGMRLALTASMLKVPIVAALSAVPAVGCHAKGASLYLKGCPLNQGRGHFLACLPQYALKCGAGDTHLFGALCLMFSFYIGQTQGLQFLVKQPDPIQRLQRHTHRLENSRLWFLQKVSMLAGTGHGC
jgi:hypothetical protein